MELLDYQEPFEEIQAKTATGTMPLAVYGLGIEQAVFLARDYGQHIAPVYDEIRANGLTEARSSEIIVDLMTEVPAMINMICFFALRCKDDGEMDAVARMPVGLRIEIVETAARVTFHSESGSGKVLGIVASAFQKAVGMAQNTPLLKR